MLDFKAKDLNHCNASTLDCSSIPVQIQLSLSQEAGDVQRLYAALVIIPAAHPSTFSCPSPSHDVAELRNIWDS